MSARLWEAFFSMSFSTMDVRSFLIVMRNGPGLAFSFLPLFSPAPSLVTHVSFRLAPTSSGWTNTVLSFTYKDMVQSKISTSYSLEKFPHRWIITVRQVKIQSHLHKPQLLTLKVKNRSQNLGLTITSKCSVGTKVVIPKISPPPKKRADKSFERVFWGR